MTILLKSFARKTTTGFLAVLPIILTIVMVVWLAEIVRDLLGPESGFGRIASSIGVTLIPNTTTAYLVGIVAMIVGLDLLGLLVLSALQGPVADFFDRTIGRIPLIGSMYNLTNRFIAIFDQKEDVDIRSMSPV